MWLLLVAGGPLDKGGLLGTMTEEPAGIGDSSDERKGGRAGRQGNVETTTVWGVSAETPIDLQVGKTGPSGAWGTEDQQGI